MTSADLEITADRLLVAAGRRTNLADLGLETIGLDPDARFLDPDEHMLVAPGVYAIGDITGKGGFTHMSMYQSAVAARHILGEGGTGAEYHAVPRVTFTDPEIGAVGHDREAGPRRRSRRSHRRSPRSPTRPAGGSTDRATTASSSWWRPTACWSARPRPGRPVARCCRCSRSRCMPGIPVTRLRRDDLRLPDHPPGDRDRPGRARALASPRISLSRRVDDAWPDGLAVSSTHEDAGRDR